MVAQAPSAGRALAFSVGGKALALPADRIAEVMATPPISRVPLAPLGLRGLANVRGKVTPIVALDVLLGGGIGDGAGQIVVLDDEVPIGLMVDRITGLTALEAGSLQWLDIDALLSEALPPVARRPVRDSVSKPRAAAPASARRAFLTFELAGQAFGIALAEVSEVARVPRDIAKLPLTDEAMVGAADIRGGLVPVVSLRAVLGLRAAAPTTAARLVIVRLGEALVALLVDAVATIIRASDDQVALAPDILNRGGGEARIDTLVRSESGLVAVLTPEKVFDEETLSAVASRGARNHAAATEAVDAASTTVVEFGLGREVFGFPLDAVVEIVRKPPTIAATPNAPTFLIGLINHRGAAIPLIDQRRRFGVGDTEGGAGQVIVTRIEGLSAGLVVDAVRRVVHVPADQISPTAGMMRDDAAVFDRVVTGDGLLLVVDPRELLDQAERDIVREFVAHAKSAA